MMYARIDERRAAPLWAAVGVPLLGIPLMVALLALLTPGTPAPAEERLGTESEPVMEVQSVGQEIAVRTDCLPQALVQG